MWIKLCGMTRRQDVQKAHDLGANAVGFIFAPSPRRITPVQAAEISAGIDIPKIGVFVDAEADTIRHAIETCGLGMVQLHGNETPQFCAQFSVPYIKALRVRDHSTLFVIPQYQSAWKMLLDAWAPGQAGGTGKQLDLSLLNNVNLSNTILAGGIKPDNVKQVLDAVRPFGLDISSGIEDAPGIKDHQKMEKLIKIIKDEQAYA